MTKRIFNLILLNLCLCAAMQAQQRNPLDLEFRLPATEQGQSSYKPTEQHTAMASKPKAKAVVERPVVAPPVVKPRRDSVLVDTTSSIDPNNTAENTESEASDTITAFTSEEEANAAVQSSKTEPEPATTIEDTLTLAEHIAKTEEGQSTDLVTTINSHLPKITTESGGFERRRISYLILLLMIGLITTFTIYLNKNLINRISRAVMNDNYLNLIFREEKNSISAYYYILYFVFLLTASLLIYFWLSIRYQMYNFYYFWLIFFIFCLIYLSRHIFINYLARIYPFGKEIKQYSFTIIVFNIFAGLLLLPIDLFIAFSPAKISEIFLIIGLFVLAITLIFRQFRGLFIASSLLNRNQFYFFIYLCAVDIVPLIVLWTYLSRNVLS